MGVVQENSPLDSLQRKCVLGYLGLMSACLLCYIYLCWHFVSPSPFNFFFGIFLLTHVVGFLLVYRLPYSSVRNIFPAIIGLSVISGCPLVILSHVMGNMNTYIWLIIAPVVIMAAMSPDMAKFQRIILCCCFLFLIASLLVISELLVGLFRDELVNWYHHLLEKDSSIKNKLSFMLPIVMGSIIMCYNLHYLLKIEAAKTLLSHANENPAANGGKEENEAEVAKYNELYKIIIQSFETDKLYLDPKLSISQLSSQLNSNVSYVARAIKQNRDMNFKTFVSIYRIEHAKKMISQNRGMYTMEYIYTASGFANQSTFNKAFRQIEGITPSDFQEKEGESEPAC